MDQMTSGAGQRVAPAGSRSWGFWATLLWGLAGVVAWFTAQFVVFVVFVTWRLKGDPGSADAKTLLTDGLLLSLATLAAAPAWIGVCALAARARGWRVRDYLALQMPRRGEVVFGVACLIALLVAFDGLTWLIGRELVPSFMSESYRSARLQGTLPLLLLAVVVVAPLCEEIAFRGFLFRGFAASPLGVLGALVITSAAWALMHVQYDVFVVGLIFGIGLLLGWLRWASGSTALTIMLHMLSNFVACVQTAIKVEWLSN
jgi:membrane protease YdiL (CAAX protease family)